MKNIFRIFIGISQIINVAFGKMAILKVLILMITNFGCFSIVFLSDLYFFLTTEVFPFFN